MPTVNGKYSMNPAVAKAKAAAAEPDEDDLIPDGHELESARIEPAENGFTVTHHTRAKPGHKPKKHKGSDSQISDYHGRSKVFEGKSGAVGHVARLLSAHEASKK